MIDERIFDASLSFVGAKALLYVGEQLAIFEQRDGNGNFPFCIDLIGGGRDADESAFETISREIREETNLVIQQSNVEHARTYPSLVDETRISFFFVIKFDSSHLPRIKQGGEGLGLVLINPNVFVTLENGVSAQQAKVKEYLLRTYTAQ